MLSSGDFNAVVHSWLRWPTTLADQASVYQKEEQQKAESLNLQNLINKTLNKASAIALKS
jgi:hypothetical protein